MMRSAARRLSFLAAAISPLLLPAASRAVILYSTPTRNTTATGTVAEIPWSLEAQWGSFLGTPIAPQYLISAIHIGNNSSSPLTFRGDTYSIDTSFGVGGRSDIPNSDLTIWKINETFPAYAPLFGTSTEANKHIVVIGRGTTRDAEVRVSDVLKGWTWGVQDGVQSWGENTIGSNIADAGANVGQLLPFEFNANVPNEGTLSAGDSSGGVFIQQNGEWQLAGLNYGADGPFSYSGADNDPGFSASIFDENGLYVQTGDGWQQANDINPIPASAYASRISSRLAAIYSIIPSFPIKQQVYIVEGASNDVGTVDASTSITMKTGSTLHAAYLRTPTLTIGASSTILLKPNGTDSAVSRLGKLTFVASASPGKLDLNDNDLIVDSTAANRSTDYTNIVTRIKASRNAATRWTGTGIASTAAANDPNQIMGLGAILNDNGHGGPLYSIWDGMPVTMNSILIKYTFMGDLNLDGGIDADDYFLIDRGFSSGGLLTGYYNGDINYDGSITADDFAYIDRAYNLQFTLPAAAASLSIPTALPEPSAAAIIFSLCSLLARRTRRPA